MSQVTSEEILAREILTEEGLVGGAAVEAWVVVEAGGYQFAFLAEEVEEVVKPRELTSVPKTPPWLAGIFLYRGQIIPVAHLGRWLGQPSEVDKSQERIIVNRSKSLYVGFWIDKVSQIASLEAKIASCDAEFGGSSLEGLLSGKIMSANGPIYLLECSKISRALDVDDLP